MKGCLLLAEGHLWLISKRVHQGESTGFGTFVCMQGIFNAMACNSWTGGLLHALAACRSWAGLGWSVQRI